MAEHKHGSMDIRAQEKTFAGFIRLSIGVEPLEVLWSAIEAALPGGKS